LAKFKKVGVFSSWPITLLFMPNLYRQEAMRTQ